MKEFGLPETPLKETEKRAAGWKEKHGVEQTEIDALATLNPNLLRQIVRGSCSPFFDNTLADRIDEARNEWKEKAQEVFDEKVDPSLIEEIRTRAEASLEDLREKLAQMEVAVEDLDIDLPKIELPQPKPYSGERLKPLVGSKMELIEAISILRARKAYTNGGDTWRRCIKGQCGRRRTTGDQRPRRRCRDRGSRQRLGV